MVGTSNLYFTTLKRAADFIVEKYMKTMDEHSNPNYFYSKWRNPSHWVEEGIYKVWVQDVNVYSSVVDIGIDKLLEAIAKSEQRLLGIRPNSKSLRKISCHS